MKNYSPQSWNGTLNVYTKFHTESGFVGGTEINFLANQSHAGGRPLFFCETELHLARNFVHTDLVQLLVCFIAKNLAIRHIPSSAIV